MQVGGVYPKVPSWQGHSAPATQRYRSAVNIFAICLLSSILLVLTQDHFSYGREL